MAAKGKKTNGQIVEIDREAYDRLQAARGTDESISEVIKRCVRPRQSAARILQALKKARISSATIEAIETSAGRRRQQPRASKD